MNTTDTETDRMEDDDCPNCGGELRRQDRINITCADCGERYSHHIEDGDDLLVTPSDEVVRRV